LKRQPAREVDQYSSPDDAVGGEVLDPEGFVAGVPDGGEGGVVVEARGALVAEVAEAVPLRGGLRVEGPDVVVNDAGGLLVEVLVEGLAGEEGGVVALGLDV